MKCNYVANESFFYLELWYVPFRFRSPAFRRAVCFYPGCHPPLPLRSSCGVVLLACSKGLSVRLGHRAAQPAARSQRARLVPPACARNTRTARRDDGAPAPRHAASRNAVPDLPRLCGSREPGNPQQASCFQLCMGGRVSHRIEHAQPSLQTLSTPLSRASTFAIAHLARLTSLDLLIGTGAPRCTA